MTLHDKYTTNYDFYKTFDVAYIPQDMGSKNTMFKVIVFLLIISAIGAIFKWLAAAMILIIWIILAIVALIIAVFVIRFIYYLFNPAAKKESLEKKRKQAEEQKAKNQRQVTVRNEEHRRNQEVTAKKELEHQRHRDSNQQDTPYTYQIGTHGNESLAIRYGIANHEKKIKEYWYHVSGGEKKHNKDRDEVFFEPASTIRLKKFRKISKDLYEVFLTDYNDRLAKVVIEAGTEYVKTFYPLDDDWFKTHDGLELTLKGNGSFTLKELATFHVQKTIG